MYSLRSAINLVILVVKITANTNRSIGDSTTRPRHSPSEVIQLEQNGNNAIGLFVYVNMQSQEIHSNQFFLLSKVNIALWTKRLSHALSVAPCWMFCT